MIGLLYSANTYHAKNRPERLKFAASLANKAVESGSRALPLTSDIAADDELDVVVLLVEMAG